MAKGFASTTDMVEKKVTFSEIGTDLYAFTAEEDPNSAIIVGDDGCLVFDAQATPAMAGKVIERVRNVTGQADQICGAVALSRGAGAGGIRLQGTRHYRLAGNLSPDRRTRPELDWDPEYGRFPRACSRMRKASLGLTWPTLTFEGEMSIYPSANARCA